MTELKIEKIVCHNSFFIKNTFLQKRLYLVKWNGYEYNECTWEPYGNICETVAYENYMMKEKDVYYFDHQVSGFLVDIDPETGAAYKQPPLPKWLNEYAHTDEPKLARTTATCRVTRKMRIVEKDTPDRSEGEDSDVVIVKIVKGSKKRKRKESASSRKKIKV